MVCLLPRGTRTQPSADSTSCRVVLQDTLGLEQAYVVGSSMGATVGFSMATLAPERVLGVFALSPLLQVEVRCRSLPALVALT